MVRHLIKFFHWTGPRPDSRDCKLPTWKLIERDFAAWVRDQTLSDKGFLVLQVVSEEVGVQVGDVGVRGVQRSFKLLCRVTV